MISTIKGFVAVTSMSLVAVVSQAADVTLFGNTINYVYDDAQTTLFGTPTIIGDTVRFTPSNFRAESNNNLLAPTSLTDTATATFVFKSVYSANGTDELLSLQVKEFGDYRIDNGGSVGGDLWLSAYSNVNALDMSIVLDDFDASGDSSGNQLWTMDALINPAAEFTYSATDMAVQIQNNLTATTTANGELAWIQKKVNFVASNPVPVPAAAWLFGSALLGLIGVARRKHS